MTHNSTFMYQSVIPDSSRHVLGGHLCLPSFLGLADHAFGLILSWRMRLCPPHLAVNTPASLNEVTFWSNLLASTITNHFIWDAKVFDEFLKRNSSLQL